MIIRIDASKLDIIVLRDLRDRWPKSQTSFYRDIIHSFKKLTSTTGNKTDIYYLSKRQ